MSDKLKDLLIFRTIKLEYPIKDGHGNDITELNVRRAKAKDLRKMSSEKDSASQEIFLFAQLTGLVMEDIDELDIADYGQLQDAFKAMAKGKSAGGI
ncbi:phage tail assembly protein [Pasteurellaceae bacterium USgator11]|nr:phage tail assembly protein [Pasteurellaceae bacterium USgator41]TNG98711.1 phage tail assembly protein [Pasteurellaceae bacterium UScroc31]TNH00078.1 phage tail assembly protein [Pasteurellaceae bacterium USgator11]